MTSQRTLAQMAFVGVLALCGRAFEARGEEFEIAPDRLPRAVLNAAKAKFPGAAIRGASRETEDGKTVFEVEMKHDGRNTDAIFQEDGALVLVEAAVAVEALPEPVKTALNAKYPGAKIRVVESVRKGPQLKAEADFYEAHLTTADKKSVEVQVNPQGKILNTETNDGD